MTRRPKQKQPPLSGTPGTATFGVDSSGQDRLYGLFMEAPAFIGIMKGRTGVIEFFNPELNKLFGHRDVVGKPMREAFPEMKGQGWFEIVERVFDTGKSVHGTEAPVLLDRGSGIPEQAFVNFVYQATHDSQGNIDGVAIYGVDVTELVEAREKAQKSEQHMSLIANAIPAVVSYVDLDETYRFVNGTYSEWFGEPGKNAVGQHISYIIGKEKYQKIRPKLKRAFSGKHTSYQETYTNKRGEDIELQVDYLPEKNKNGEVRGVIVLGYDITKHKHDKAALRESEARLNFVFQNAADIINVCKADGTITYQSPAMNRVLGHKTKDRIGKNIFDSKLTHPADRMKKNRFLKRLMKAKPGTQLTDEFRLRHANGSWRVMEIVGINLLDDPELDGILLSSRDITKRKQAEQDLQSSVKRFRTMVEQSPLSVQIFDPKGQTIAVNPAWEKLWGASRKELGDYNILKDKQLKTSGIMPYIKQAFAGEAVKLPTTHYDPAQVGKPGRDRWIEGYIYPLIAADGKTSEVALVHNDITERKSAEENLRDSEERLRTMAEFMPQKIFTATPDGDIDYCNLQWTDYSGRPLEELMGIGWEQLIHEEDIDEHRQQWMQAIKTGNTFELEERLLNHKGAYCWHITRARPMRNDAGAITAWMGSSTDIDDSKRTTERKQELEVITAGLQEQRRQLVELSDAKDEFISLASHQLRTPATGVKQYIGMLLEGFAGDIAPTQKAFLEQAYESNERQLAIIDDLLQVAQVDAGKMMLNKRSTDLVHLTKDVLHEQESKFSSRRQKLSFNTSRKEIIAHVDKNRLRMVLENLIDNAHKYTPEGKHIDVRITKRGNYAYTAITDQGVGIKSTDQHKVFEKFSRLRNSLSLVNSGSGLGLYWAKGIVDLHGGHISITSKPGKGSIFTIKLPL